MGPAKRQHGDNDTYDRNIQSGETASETYTVDFEETDPSTIATMKRAALFARGMPQLRQSHPANEFIVVVGQRASKTPSTPKRVTVVINYASVKLNVDQVQPPNVIKRRWFFSATQEEIDTDIYGRPLVNSAGEPFETAITRPFNDIAGQFTYRTVNYDPVFAHSFMDHVNDGMFLGFEPGVAKLVEFSAEDIENEDGNNWNISIEIHFRFGGWRRRIRDQGYTENFGPDPDDGEPLLKPIVYTSGEFKGEPVRNPYPLNGNGFKILNVKPDTQAVFLHFEVFPTRNFDLLNLG